MSNIKEVAKAAGVSTATVSRVLNQSGYVSEASRQKVKQAIERLQYRPSAIARSLKQDKTFTIGIIIPDISNPYFMNMAKGIEETTGVHGYQILFSSSDEDPDKEEHLLRLMHDKRVDVIVLVPSAGATTTLNNIIQSSTPVIAADRVLSDPSVRIDYFLENNAEATRELTRKIIERGHRRIGVIHGGLEVSTSKERMDGHRQALEEIGLSTDPELLFNGRYTLEGGAEAAKYFLKMDNQPTAILSLNNSMAFGALLSLKRAGIRIPDQIAFASYGAIDGAQLLDGSEILYIDQRPDAIGRAIGERILRYQRLQAGERMKPVMQRFENQICEYK